MACENLHRRNHGNPLFAEQSRPVRRPDEQLFGEEQPNDHIEQAQGHNDDRESGILVAYQFQTAHGCTFHFAGFLS
jgi:hypothetical protein